MVPWNSSFNGVLVRFEPHFWDLCTCSPRLDTTPRSNPTSNRPSHTARREREIIGEAQVELVPATSKLTPTTVWEMERIMRRAAAHSAVRKSRSFVVEAFRVDSAGVSPLRPSADANLPIIRPPIPSATPGEGGSVPSTPHPQTNTQFAL